MKISLFIFIIFNICGIIIKRVIKMQKESKFKVEKNILIPLILFMIISVIMFIDDMGVFRYLR